MHMEISVVAYFLFTFRQFFSIYRLLGHVAVAYPRNLERGVLNFVYDAFLYRKNDFFYAIISLIKFPCPHAKAIIKIR